MPYNHTMVSFNETNVHCRKSNSRPSTLNPNTLPLSIKNFKTITTIKESVMCRESAVSTVILGFKLYIFSLISGHGKQDEFAVFMVSLELVSRLLLTQ